MHDRELAPSSLVPATIRLVGDAILSTCARRIVTPDAFREWTSSTRPFVGAMWHEGIFLMAQLAGRRKIAILSSFSRDGDYSTRIMRRMGHHVIRGSSSRGGAEAVRPLVRLLRDGIPVILTVDGPHGPAHVVKEGCVVLAQLAGCPVVPLACALSPALRLRNWDRTAIPLPFSRLTLAYGDPVAVPRRLPGDSCELLCGRLQQDLDELNGRCRQAV